MAQFFIRIKELPASNGFVPGAPSTDGSPNIDSTYVIPLEDPTNPYSTAVKTNLHNIANWLKHNYVDGNYLKNVTKTINSDGSWALNFTTDQGALVQVIQLELGSNTSAGLMPPQAWEAIEDLQTEVAHLHNIGSIVSVNNDLPSGMDNATLLSLWNSSTNNAPLTNQNTMLSLTTHNRYIYNSLTDSWEWSTVPSISIATDTDIGGVLSTEDVAGNEGMVFVELNGQMSVIGWTDLVDQINTLASNVPQVSVFTNTQDANTWSAANPEGIAIVKAPSADIAVSTSDIAIGEIGVTPSTATDADGSQALITLQAPAAGTFNFSGHNPIIGQLYIVYNATAYNQTIQFGSLSKIIAPWGNMKFAYSQVYGSLIDVT